METRYHKAKPETTSRTPDPNRPTYESKEGAYDERGLFAVYTVAPIAVYRVQLHAQDHHNKLLVPRTAFTDNLTGPDLSLVYFHSVAR